MFIKHFIGRIQYFSYSKFRAGNDALNIYVCYISFIKNIVYAKERDSRLTFIFVYIQLCIIS